MVKELQSILLENVEISVPGYSLRRLALNQHMPKVEKLSEHRHGYDQWLLYLRGSGRQRILDRETPVRRGTVLFVGRDTSHRFRKESEVRPVCLVIDLEVTSSWDVPQEGMMSTRELEEIERLLVSIHEETRKEGDRTISTASSILQIVALIQKGFESREEAVPPSEALVEEAIQSAGLAKTSPGAIAASCGCTLDHLNRRLKNDGGKTVGALLAEKKLQLAMKHLAGSTVAVGEVGSLVGMDDQNYFARWFRKQTGTTPSQWRILHRNSS